MEPKPTPKPNILRSRRGVALLLVLIVVLFGVIYVATGATAFLRTQHAEQSVVGNESTVATSRGG